MSDSIGEQRSEEGGRLRRVKEARRSRRKGGKLGRTQRLPQSLEPDDDEVAMRIGQGSFERGST